MKNKGVIILSIIINIILISIFCNFIRINGSIIKERQIIKEMSESTQVTDLNNQINALNTEHTEYMNYIQTCKAQLASAITEMGVETSENANIDAMASNIRSISGASSADKISYDNTNSGLTSTNVQGAIDEVNNGLMKLDTCDLLGSNASTTENTITANINNYKFLVLGEFNQSDNSSCTIVTIPVSLFKITKIFTSRYNGTGSTASTSFGAKATYISDNQFRLKILTAASGYEARLYGIK